jgi:hypothetical protein
MRQYPFSNQPKEALQTRVWNKSPVFGRKPGADPVKSPPTAVSSRFGRDLTGIGLRPADTERTGCPLFPQRCPFGGACHLCPPRMQAKTKSGNPGDHYEQEAETMAGKILQMPEALLPPAFRPFTHGTAFRNIPKRVPATGAYQAEFKELGRLPALSGGRPLSPATRAFMEPRFGSNFSQVRIHTDEQARRASSRINAQAFTHGSDVYLGPGENEGNKRLMAHELTHVLQQQSPAPLHTGSDLKAGIAIQRRVSDQMATIRDNLTYGIVDWRISDAEAHQVLMILKALNDANLADTVATMEAEGLVDRLFSNVSEQDQHNEAQTLERIHRLRVHTKTHRNGQTEVTTTVVGPCTPDQMHLIRTKTETAKDWARRAKERVNAYIGTPANHAGVAQRLDTHFFHESNAGNLTVAQKQGHARQIRDNLETVERQNNPFSNYCASGFDPLCRAMAAAYVSSSSRQITFCASFFSSSDNWQTFALFHELMHAYAEVDDRGYGNERIFAYLTPAQAINNADSYALFVVDVLNVAGGAREVRSAAPEDRYSDCEAAQRTTLQRDFAFAARMVLNALNILPDTPRIGAAEARTHFKTDDPGRLARVIDHFKALKTELSGRINFECEDRCGAGVTGYYYRVFGTTAHVCPAYFSITSEDDREDELLLIVAVEELGMGNPVRPGQAVYATQSENQAYDNPGAYIGYARAVTNKWWP